MDYLCEVIIFAIDALIFGTCMKFFYKTKNALSVIGNAPSLVINEDLKDIVEMQPGKKMYVILHGMLQPIGEAIISKNNSQVFGAIQLLRIREHLLKRESIGFWAEREKIIQEAYNIMPFALTNNGYSVEIVDPLAADVLDMDVISDIFTPSVTNALDSMWEFFWGIKQTGVQVTERMLRTDARIMGIGELVISKAGNNLLLQPPSDGSPFYITNKHINCVIKKLVQRKNTYRKSCILFGTVGIVIAGLIISKIYKNYKNKLDIIKLKEQLEKNRAQRRERVRDDNLPESQLCVVCKLNPKEIILLPCGHVCLCEECCINIDDYCPVCRKFISSKYAAYIT